MCKNKKELLSLLKNQESNIYFMESKILLSEGIICLENELFMASLGVFMTFLEKHLRDMLIFRKFHINPKDIDILLKYDEVEKEIEEENDGKKGKKKYDFYGICDGLVRDNFFDKDFSDRLKEKYKKLRIPIHHGIYKRLVNNQNDNFIGTAQRIEEIDGKITHQNIEIEQSNIMIRDKILPDVFEFYCYEMVEIIIEILETKN